VTGERHLSNASAKQSLAEISPYWLAPAETETAGLPKPIENGSLAASTDEQRGDGTLASNHHLAPSTSRELILITDTPGAGIYTLRR